MRKLLLVTVLLATVLLGAKADVDPNFYIYICFGQSNMEGNAQPEAVDKTGIAALASVVKAGFKVVKKIVVDGVEQTIESAMAEATKAEAPSGGTPTITSAKTRGESEGSVNIAGGILDVVGQNLETATAVELWSDGATPALWQTIPATYADGKLTTGELDYDEAPSEGGTVRVTTAGGTASYDITYCAH